MIKVNTIKEAVQTAVVFLATALLVATLTSCENDGADRYKPQLEGVYAVDWDAYEDNGVFFANVDTTIENLCIVEFADNKLTTYKYTEPNYFIRESIEIMGSMYGRFNSFDVEYRYQSIIIRLDVDGQIVEETWFFYPSDMQLVRTTRMGAVTQVHTMILKEIK